MQLVSKDRMAIALYTRVSWPRLLVPLREKGRTVFHCHIVEHEDRGMMGVLEVG
ncbi:hypothetical protein MHTCC0001_36730 [Flavobacteriaceae bacterium MHTCC 0001]